MAGNVSPVVSVLRVADISHDDIDSLFHRFGLTFRLLGYRQQIAGSYWGEPEAGVLGHTVIARPDTPVHSVLHEMSHVICMTDQRRHELCGDAGGDDLEEAAVCYLQILLADLVPGVGRQRLMCDMDDWGYSFRLGRTSAWFEDDADDARLWLLRQRLLGANGAIEFRLRDA